MAKQSTKRRPRIARTNSTAPPTNGEAREFPMYCSTRPEKERVVEAGISAHRLSLIQAIGKKWVNGTVLHYYFFDKPTDGEMVRFADGSQEFRTWLTSESEKKAVRKAFGAWKQVGIGLHFEEVSARTEAEIRIGFMRGDGAWSYIGRDILIPGSNERTMNFGWNVTNDPDTAIHEIGHTLGFHHEHQNPNAGIVWDEETVYAALAKPPNRWDRATTFHNIIRKIEPDQVQGSNWDQDSVMHYPFAAGLIKEPAQLRSGLQPAGGLSERDKSWVRTFYPPQREQDLVELKPFQSMPIASVPGEQLDFVIRPEATRQYTIKSFGPSDLVMVLFENENGNPRYLSGEDDGGTAVNAQIEAKLLAGRQYLLRVRTYYASGDTAVMLW